MNNSKAEIGIAWATTKPLQADGKRDKSEEERHRSVTDGGGATTAADDGGAMSGHSRGRMVKDKDYSAKLWLFRCSSTLKYSKMKRQKSTQQKLLRKSKQARLSYRHSKLQMDRRPQPHHGPPAAFTNALIASAALLIAAFSLISSMSTHHSSLTILHQVPEGYVGVYWKGGAILENITGPGFHWKLPLVTHYEPIQVTLQTDQVRDIPCGTKGGVMINFTRIEVVNRLRKDYVYETLLNYGVHYDNTWIYDKIHHEINQFCSSHTLQQVYIDMFDQIDERMKEALQVDCTRYAPGIEIISVRVTKPTIPESIRRNFEQMEEERTKVLIAIEKQKVVEKEAETQKKMAILEAEKNASVSRIMMEQKLMEKETAKRLQQLENEIYLAREKSLTDANANKMTKEAEANKLLLTPQYLELKFIQAITNNSKIFYGDKLPNMVFDQKLLGSFLQNVLATSHMKS